MNPPGSGDVRPVGPALSVGRRIGWWLATLASGGLAVVLGARLTGIEPGPLVWLLALLPLFALAAPALAALALWARAWFALAIALLTLGGAVSWYAPMFVATTAPTGPAQNQVVVATANLKFGKADARAVVDMVREEGVEVLGVQELTPTMARELDEAGLGDMLPHALLDARRGAGGTGLYSASSLADARTVTGLRWAVVAATVEIEGAAPLEVYVVHPSSPGEIDHDFWARDLDAFHRIVADETQTNQAAEMLVLGDFNATLDHAPMRRILDAGLVDAAEQAGAGIVPTFPSGPSPPALAAIDHVLASTQGPVATAVHSVTLPGTDHRALVVRYSVEAG